MKPRRTAKTTSSAADFIPPNPTLPKLRAAAADCRGCPLWKVGTQTVFGEGPRQARLLVVGETPGDAEDKAGKPFVGPAGRLLDRAFEAAGIDREDVYLTNAVKHFKWARDARSKRRIHKTPNAGEIRACFPWLEQELALVKPQLILCLGAVAAKTLLGRTFSVTAKRGLLVKTELGQPVIATVHPAAVLRAPPGDRKRAERMFITDLRKVVRELAKAEGTKQATVRRGKFSGWPTTASRSGDSSAPIPSSRE
jgi:DNA polymerase